MSLEYSFTKIRLPFLGFFCLLLFSTLAKAQISENEKMVLIEFYENTNGTEWTNSWNLSESVNIILFPSSFHIILQSFSESSVSSVFNGPLNSPNTISIPCAFLQIISLKIRLSLIVLRLFSGPSVNSTPSNITLLML